MATRVNLYCLVGDSNAGKSKTIRSLADGNLNGVGKLPDIHSVRLHDGGFLKIFVRVTSFQELNFSPQESQQFLEKKIRNISKHQSNPNGGFGPIYPSVFNALISLRLNPQPHAASVAKNIPARTLPAAWEYLSHYASIGWKIKRLAMLPTEDNSEPAEFGNFLHHAADYQNFGAPVYFADAWADPIDKISWKISGVRNHFGWA